MPLETMLQVYFLQNAYVVRQLPNFIEGSRCALYP